MSEKRYDAIIVGSGATGGFAAKELTERGLEVAVLEAGGYLKEAWFHQGGNHMKGVGAIGRIKAALRGQSIQARAAFFNEDNSYLFVNDRKNPYTYDDFYLWVRGKNVGGRFLSWGRVAVRMSDYDFKGGSRDGKSEDWPITYNEMVPYYDHVEEFLGIVGTSDGIPNLPDGKYVKKAGYSKLERKLKDYVESSVKGAHLVPWRYVVEEATPVDETKENRTSSPLVAAHKTGRMDLRANAVVKNVIVDDATGKATGVCYIDAITKQEVKVYANVVLLCASTIETIRLMLNSKSPKHPNGLGNSSGLLGHYFMDQCPSVTFGTVPGEKGWELVDGTDAGNNHGGLYIPRFQNLDSISHPEFSRGFNIQGMVGRGYVPDDMNTLFGFMGQGEMLPHYENSITIGRKKDAWGIPAPHVRLRMTEDEKKVMLTEREFCRQMAKGMGWQIDFSACLLGLSDDKLLPNAGTIERVLFRMGYKTGMGLGASIHECGGVRFGADPKKSILNPQNQCWDVPNVFVTDSSCFPSNGTCGPTLTTMALTVRACEYIAQEYGKSAELSSSALREV